MQKDTSCTEGTQRERPWLEGALRELRGYRFLIQQKISSSEKSRWNRAIL
jgi:hypothetical protein